MRTRVRRIRIVVLSTVCITAGTSVGWTQEALQPAFRTADDREGADVLGALKDSLTLLLIEHGTRIGVQEKTRSELGGKFWRDYKRSVRVPKQWGDTDGWMANYAGHPMQGAGAGYIWLDHDPYAPRRFSGDRRYWLSRARATAWAAVYSLQFEIGPLSEASIGNVGMRPETTGWVDYVMTPAGALGLIVAGDALDRFALPWIEERVRSPLLRMPIRIALNPGRTVANGSSGRAPWHRDDRPLDWR